MKKKKSQTSKTDLKRIFNAFARKTVNDFPKLKDKFVLYSAPTDTWHGSLAGNDNPVPSNIDEEILDDLKDSEEGKSDLAFAIRTSRYYAMAYVLNDKNRVMTSINEPREHEIEAILQHELGHLVAPAGYYNKGRAHTDNFRECVADTFSFIRQIQEHKDRETAFKATICISAQNFILRSDSLYFTVPVLKELRELSQKCDLSKLTPVQSANLAYRISLKYAPSKEKMRHLNKIFEPVREIENRGGDQYYSVLKKCAEIMLKYDGKYSRDVFNTCKAILEPFLEGDKVVLRTLLRKDVLANLNLEGKFWDDLREKVKKSEKGNKPQLKDMFRQAAARDADYLQVLGHFDRGNGGIINPKNYESEENRKQLQRRRDSYIAARTSGKRKFA